MGPGGVSGMAGGRSMRTEREELENLREELEKLMDFIRNMETGDLPYFYRYFDAMKNNIEIFFWVGEEDTEDIIPVLERDWEASHSVLIGVQNYDIRKEHPDADPVLCIYFASILSDIGRFFECRGKEA